MQDQSTSQSTPLGIPRWLDRSASWAWRLLLLGTSLVATLWLFSTVRIAVVPALIAMVVSAALYPFTASLRRWRVPTWLAAALPLLAVVALAALAIWFTSREAAQELTSSEVEMERIRSEIETWLMGEPFNLTDSQIIQGEEDLEEWLIGGAQSWGASRGGLALSILGGATLSFVLIYLFLKDGPKMWAWVVARIAPARRDRIDSAGRAAVETMAGYMRGVVLAGVFDSILIGVGLAVLEVPLVLPLMILTFFAALFPVIGAAVAGLAAATVALVLVGPGTALIVLAMTAVIQQIEGNLVVPLIMGHQVSLHPSAVLLSLTAGGAVAGLPGAFLAVPVVAAGAAAVSAFGSLTGEAPIGGASSGG